MAGRLIKAARQTAITAANTGIITCGSTAGFYERAFAWLKDSGQPGVKVQIVEVTDATHLKVRIVPMDGGIAFSGNAGTAVDESDIQGTGPNYGVSDISDYNGGSISQPEQLVYNRNDAPLT